MVCAVAEGHEWVGVPDIDRGYFDVSGNVTTEAYVGVCVVLSADRCHVDVHGYEIWLFPLQESRPCPSLATLFS